MAEKKIPVIVKAFEDFSIFCKTRWRAAVLGTVFIAILGGLFLLLYFGYKKIDSIGTEVDKSVEILEQTHETPDALQEGFIQSVDENLRVERAMTKCVYEHGADSMLVAKFHNSRTDLQGKHDFFYSATNEVIKEQGLSSLPAMQNIPIVRLGEYITPLLAGKCQVVSVPSMESNPWLKSRLESQGINSLISCPVFDGENRLLGFTELIYNLGTEVPVGDELRDLLRRFKELTEHISLILSK